MEDRLLDYEGLQYYHDTKVTPLVDKFFTPEEKKNNYFNYAQTDIDYDGVGNLDVIRGKSIPFVQLVGSSDTSITLQSGHVFYTIVSGTKSKVTGTGQSISVTGGTDMVFDLTFMYLDTLTLDQIQEWFESYFPLTYYSNQQKLLSFNATGLKTQNQDQTKSNTLSLPISTIFPTGMKSAGSAYDELTKSKAIKRVEDIDASSITYTYSNGVFSFAKSDLDKAIKANVDAGLLCSKYAYGTTGDKIIYQDATTVYIKDSSYTTTSDFTTMLASENVIIRYELATPVESSVDLDFSYDVYKDGTTQVLPVNTSTPSTTPIDCDISYIKELPGKILSKMDHVSNATMNNFAIFGNNGQVVDGGKSMSDLLNIIYPVGAVYTSVNNTNPSTLFGGTWETIAGGGFPTIDVTNLIASASLPYTATEDCWVCGSSIAGNNSTLQVSIDDVWVATCSDHWTAWSFPLKKGQKISSGGSYNAKIYGISSSVYMWKRTA